MPQTRRMGKKIRVSIVVRLLIMMRMNGINEWAVCVHSGSDEFVSNLFNCEIEPRREVERLQRELGQLRRDRERLMRLAAAGAQIPILLHELRKPLANVAAALETNLLVETMATPALLHAVLVEVQRMASMLDTAGAATRDLRAPVSARIDLDLDDCQVLLAEVTARAGIDLVWQIDPMPPLPFDAQVLRSILCNLVTNAIDACAHGDCIEVCAMTEDGTFVLQVLDTGVGMSPETLAQCTEAFFSTKPSGFGIGLALCRELVEAAGGSFEIASQRGSGTRVLVWLPLDLERAPSPPSASRLADHLE